MSTPHASWAEIYDEAYRRCFGISYDSLTEATLARIGAIQPPPARIVDYGAGTGRLSIPLARAGYQVTAVEPCSEMLDELLRKAADDGLDIGTVCCRVQDEFSAARFDLALCVFTVVVYIQTDQELATSFRRIAARLRPGGRLLIDVPSLHLFRSYAYHATDFNREVRVTHMDGALFRYEENVQVRDGEGWRHYRDDFQIRHWTESQVLAALHQAGFTVEKDPLGRHVSAGAQYYLAVKGICSADVQTPGAVE